MQEAMERRSPAFLRRSKFIAVAPRRGAMMLRHD